MKLPTLSLVLPLLMLSLATDSANSRLQKIRFGVILPETLLITLRRAYSKKITETVDNLMKGKYSSLNFTNFYEITAEPKLSISIRPTTKEILMTFCDHLLSKGVVSILYFTNSEVYGSNAAVVQYILQLTAYLGIPVIAWNADNIGLEQNQRLTESKVLQLAPSVEYQSAAMLSILQRYTWNQFSIVTTQLGGHDDFIRSIRDQAKDAFRDSIFNIFNYFILKNMSQEGLKAEMKVLADSEARVFLLYCTKEEAERIMSAANHLEMTGKNYIWIVTQSVIGYGGKAPDTFPAGMLGIHFNSTKDRLFEEIENAITVFAHGLELFVNDPRNLNYFLNLNLDCNGSDVRWTQGDYFFKYLKNVSISKYGRPPIEFNADGTLKYVELEVMNLGVDGFWHKIGTWNRDNLVIKDIVWPGNSPAPPPGVPEKFNLRITFMEEPPYVNMVPPDNETGECKSSRAVRCRVAKESEMLGVNRSLAIRNPKYFMCCSGFCIDLLQKFATDLKFTYELYRVEDGVWGILKNNTWNGLIREILNTKADVVVTSFKANSERQTAVDFTVPFMETGIAIVVAKRTGIISPKAFLEPFDTVSWLMILLVSIQVAALAIFMFEWISPFGYGMKMMPPRNHKFSLFRTYWLVWAILFGASVNVDCPRGYTARFMSIVWAMFAVVFLAIYTANLAAFMITREEFHDLTGIEDKRLENPMMIHPPFRFGTIPNGNTEAVMKQNKPELYHYMKKYNRETVQDGIKAVKKGELDAFIYDATVLDYLVGQDNECRLLTAGSWYAMTGYGFAFPKKSKYLDRFNKMMIKYKENGDIERFQRFWLQGVCKPNKHKRNASNPLDINQFMSAFLLLGCGVLFTIIILVLEHLYFRYVRKHLARKDNGGFFTLLSLSMGKSLSFRGAVYEAQDMLKHHRCKDPICDTQLWKAKYRLDMANMRIRQLEKQLSERNKIHPEDMTSNHINYYNTSSCLPSGGRMEIAEIETVL
ncbi:glutamate receptor ionotropic, NMDA 2B-like [Centruroides sculpturatus]|uniref:glutamate receptor ionotropic, NMDA 2B-like n=1 Tax=Centruroides sculpturatus TaxID=218467 RepID=UPI000C6E18AA|nr:glutamate receptor ionotropic, NMDA 2B-like [Centruroides sculpturatus]